jgi:hypothetical protein
MDVDLDSFEPLTDLPLDAGIRHAVLVLRSQGVETFESCEGGEGHAMPDPTVRFHGGQWAGYRAFAIAMEHGLPVLHLRYTFTAVNGHLEAPCWELTFGPSVREMR